jgi:WD40 repeat protein
MSCIYSRLLLALGLVLMMTLAARSDPAGGAKQAPPGNERPRTDQYGDPLPPGALVRIGTTRLRHGGDIHRVVFAPDAKFLASGSEDATIRLWETGTGKELRRLTGHTGPVAAVALSANGRTLVSGGSDGTIRQWDTTSGRELRKFTVSGEKSQVGALAVSPDGKALASAETPNLVRLLDMATGKETQSWSAAPPNAWSLAFSPDSKYVAVRGTGGIQVWETASGNEIGSFQESLEDPVFGPVVFAPDGQTLAWAGNDGIRLWKPAAEKEPHFFTGDQGEKLLAVLVAFTQDRRILMGCNWDRTVQRRELATGKETARRIKLAAGGEPLALSPDGKTIALRDRHVIRLCDAETGQEKSAHTGHVWGITKLALSPDGKTLATGDPGDDAVRLWDIGTGRQVGRWTVGHEPQIHAQDGSSQGLAFSPDGALLTLMYDHDRIRLWDVPKRRELNAWSPGLVNGDVALAFLPGGKALASKGDAVLKLWEVPTGKQLRDFPLQPEGHVIQGFALSPDGKTLATGDATFVRLIDVAEGREVRRLKGSDVFSSVAFSPDGRLLASGYKGGSMALWEVASGKQIGSLRGHRHRVHSLSFSPDGKLLASADHSPVGRVWEVASGGLIGTLDGHAAPVTALVFSPGGGTIVSASQDTTALVWEVPGGEASEAGPEANLTPDELSALWVQLAGDDTPRARRALGRLVRALRQSVSFLAEKVRPVSPVAPARLARLIAELEDNRIRVRERAEAELRALGEAALPALRKACEDRPPAELRPRIERMLEAAEKERWVPSGERLRALRALEVLERVDVPEARQVLQKLAEGTPDARLTEEAKASLERLGKRSAGSR